MGSSSLSPLLSTPLALAGMIAVALAALLVLLTAMTVRRGAQALLMPAATALIAAVAVLCAGYLIAANDQSAEQRFLVQRMADLSALAARPDSIAGCLLGIAGETVENACEKKVFASPQSTAAAAAFVSAQLSLLADARKLAADEEGPAVDAMRHTIELDRYGIAAHVLATRDGCTFRQCAAFVLVNDASTLKANLKANAYETYIGRYVAAGNAPPPPAEVAPPAVTPPVAAAEPLPHENVPVSSKYDFPSAASIPAVSIMNKEPPLPGEPKPETKTPANDDEGAVARLPLPPKRPRTEAAVPPAR